MVKNYRLERIKAGKQNLKLNLGIEKEKTKQEKEYTKQQKGYLDEKKFEYSKEEKEIAKKEKKRKEMYKKINNILKTKIQSKGVLRKSQTTVNIKETKPAEYVPVYFQGEVKKLKEDMGFWK